MAKSKPEPLFYPVYLTINDKEEEKRIAVGHVYLKPGAILPGLNLCTYWDKGNISGFEIMQGIPTIWGKWPIKVRKPRVKKEIVKPAIRHLDLED